MLAEIKQHIAQLAETNRAMVDDLDASRRIAAELGRERDALQRAVEAAAGRTALLEERLRELAAELLEAERERDDLQDQLRESSGTMDEILRCLELVTPGAVPDRRHLRAV